MMFETKFEFDYPCDYHHINSNITTIMAGPSDKSVTIKLKILLR